MILPFLSIVLDIGQEFAHGSKIKLAWPPDLFFIAVAQERFPEYDGGYAGLIGAPY